MRGSGYAAPLFLIYSQSKSTLMQPIHTPKWLVAGLKFTAKHITDNLYCELISFNTDNNTAIVTVYNKSTSFTENDWNLQHMLYGFENGDYTMGTCTCGEDHKPKNYMAMPGIVHTAKEHIVTDDPLVIGGLALQESGEIVEVKSINQIEVLTDMGAKAIRLKQSSLDTVGGNIKRSFRPLVDLQQAFHNFKNHR